MVPRSRSSSRHSAGARAVPPAGRVRRSSSESAPRSFENLTHTEQAAASLGVHPDAWKPISFMNTAHYGALLRANALDDTLARRIEAFKTVSAA